jgi:hypothetical protein
LGSGQLDVSELITHRFSIDEAPKAYRLITGKTNEPFLGVLLTYPQDTTVDLKAAKTRFTIRESHRPGSGQVNLGVIGAGNFAGAVMLPVLKSIRSVNLVGIASASGLSAQHAARKFGFSFAASDADAIFSNPEINTVVLLTPS